MINQRGINAAAIGFWLLMGCLSAARFFFSAPPDVTAAAAPAWVAGKISIWGVWGLFTVLTSHLGRRFQLTTWRHALVHVLFGLLVAALHVGFCYVVGRLTDFSIFPSGDTGLLYRAYFSGLFIVDVGIYWAVLMFSHAVEYYRLYRERERLAATLQTELAASQLSVLKMQLHPHFYFNTLNNLYGLALTKSDRTPGAVLQLSAMMRYIIYDAQSATVPLGAELAFIQNYIELEKLRYESGVPIELVIHGSANEQRIAPLLMMPLVENAFKHGLEQQASDGWIKIAVTIAPEGLCLEVKNYSEGALPKRPAFARVPIDTGSAAPVANRMAGIGLHNVQKRLTLLYPSKHRLEIEHQENCFSATLSIEL